MIYKKVNFQAAILAVMCTFSWPGLGHSGYLSAKGLMNRRPDAFVVDISERLIK